MAKGKSVCVKVYLNQELFAEMAQEAEKAGKRRKGLLLFTQKEHGFSHEKVANTDGLAKYMKFCHNYYKDHYADRLREQAELEQREKEIQELKKQKGFI